MTQVQQPLDTQTIRGLFASVLRRVLLTWIMLAAVITLAIGWLAPELTWPSLTIAGMSGLISIIALVPGISLGDRSAARAGSADAAKMAPNSTRTLLFIVGSVAAMAIRVAGTVALLVACRYQMGLPLQTMAFLVCGWYVVLTSVEITWLAKGASSIDSNRLESGLQLAASTTLADGTDC